MQSNGRERSFSCPFAYQCVGLGVAAVFSIGCGASKPPAPPPKKPVPVLEDDDDVVDEPTPPEPIESGLDCVKAVVQCEPGICTAKINNRCDAPVACHFSVLSLCQGGGEGRGGNRGTIRAKSKGEIQATAGCDNRRIEFSQADALKCQ